MSNPARTGAVLCCAHEKYLMHGAESLSDAELLTAFISKDCNTHASAQLAFHLMQEFGNLRAILNSDAITFQKVPGLSAMHHRQLQTAREICRRSDWISLQNTVLNSIQETHTFLKRQLRDKKYETCAAIFLDHQHRVLSYEVLSTGTIHGTIVYIRPIIARMLQLNATSLILAHNHPSGLANASLDDITTTKRLQNALQLIDAHLLDHIIVGDNEIYSIINALKLPCH